MKKKEGIKIISDSDDLYNLFDIKKENDSSKESFEELLKASENDPELKKIQKKKSEIIKNSISRKDMIRSYPKPQSQCDLHGLTSAESEIKIESFLYKSKQYGYKTVKIITGKGHHSIDGPVLRDKVEKLANLLKKNDSILGWNWEKKYKEKSGAIIFYL